MPQPGRGSLTNKGTIEGAGNIANGFMDLVNQNNPSVRAMVNASPCSSRQQPMHRSQRLLEPVDSIVPSIVEAVCRTKMLQLLSKRRDCPRLLLEEGHRKLIEFHITRIPLSEYLKNFGVDLIRAVSLIEVMAAIPLYLP